MQKKLFAFFLAITLLSTASQSHAQRTKSELTLGWGFYSIYQFVNHPPYNTSSGTWNLGYRYYVSRDVTLGLGIGIENISNWATFTSIVPEITVKYLDTKDDRVRVRLYGSAAYGLTAISDLHVGPGQVDESGLKPWGFQFNPIGMRLGRRHAFFTELGFGYRGIVHVGYAYRFNSFLPHYHEHGESNPHGEQQ